MCVFPHLDFVGVHALLLLVGALGQVLGLLLLQVRASAEEDVVDEGVLQQRQEHEHEAAHQVDVDGLHVRDLGQCLAQMGVDGGHSQHSSDPYGEQEESVRGTAVRQCVLRQRAGGEIDRVRQREGARERGREKESETERGGRDREKEKETE